MDYIKGTYKILKESSAEARKYVIEISGKKFVVFPNVFSPKYFKDTKFFVDNLLIRSGESFLEIGSGIGVISIFALMKGASNVVATDINPDAVKNTKENVKIHKLSKKIKVLQGDLFLPLKSSEKFDIIFWNTPFGFVKKEKLSLMEKSVFDTTYKDIRKFIKGSKKHLKENGKLLIGFSSTVGKFDLLKEILDKNNFKFKIIAETTARKGNPMGSIKLELFEAKLK